MFKKGTPWIGFDKSTLDKFPIVHAGDSIRCPHCGGEHVLLPAEDEDGKPTELILYYRCGKKLYVAAINNHCIVGIKPDISGRYL